MLFNGDSFKDAQRCRVTETAVVEGYVRGYFSQPTIDLMGSWGVGCEEEPKKTSFYSAMHFSAKRGIAIACRLSVCPSVCNVGKL